MNKEELVDKIVREWSYRCKKGYPDLNNKEDLIILDEILRISEEAEEGELTDMEFSERLPQVIKSKFNELDDSTKGIFRQNYKKHSLEDFVKDPNKFLKIFQDFFNLSWGKGVGRGEFIPLLAIKNSKSGGISDKDISVEGKVLEVKELDKSNNFLPGKSGTAIGSTLKKNIDTFFNWGLDNSIVSQFEDSELQELVEKIKNYYVSTYASGNFSNTFRQYLRIFIEEFKKQKADIISSVVDLNYVKVDGKRYSFTREEGNLLRLGDTISEDEANLKKFTGHDYITGKSTFDKDLELIKDNFLNSIDYLLIFQKGGAAAVVLDRKDAKDKLKVQDLTQNTVRLKYSGNL